MQSYDHIAIMKKSWGLTEKVLTGQKTIESRWYRTKRAPWDRVKRGDTVYFKNSGEPVSIRTIVRKVTQFPSLTSKQVKELLLRYGARDGIERAEIPKFFLRFKDKTYCILIFFAKPVRIKPFEIDKTGFGAMAAWITVKNIASIKIK